MKNKNPTVKTLNLLITTISLVYVMICLNVRIDDWIIGLKTNWNLDGLLNKRGAICTLPKKN